MTLSKGKYWNESDSKSDYCIDYAGTNSVDNRYFKSLDSGPIATYISNTARNRIFRALRSGNRACKIV